MAKFAPVCPIHIYRGLKAARMFRDYFLLLAHDVAANQKAYNKVFTENLPYPDTTNIIMDNSVIELGGYVDLNLVNDAVRATEANVVVLPDVLENGAATAKATLKHFGVWKDTLPKGTEFMFVPQGETLEDWIICLETVLQELKPYLTWIGIPRNTPGRIVDSRRTLIDITTTLIPDARIHLLGFSNNIVDDIRSCLHSGTYGIDSAVPLRLATQGKPMSLVADPGPRGTWWQEAAFTRMMVKNTDRTSQLIS